MEKEVEDLFGDHVLKAAARLFGLKAEGFKQLGNFENYVYEADKDGVAKILRLTHSSHRTEAEVAGEMDWIDFLLKQGVDIPKYDHSLQGNRTEKILTGASYFTAVVFEKAEGKHAKASDPEIWNEALFKEWGRITGHMHRETRGYQPPTAHANRPLWDEDDLYKNAKNYIRLGDEFVLERLDALLKHLSSLPITADSYGLIHTDIHSGNFFVDQGRIRVFDFDDCCYLWFVHDIAIPLYYSLSWGVPASYEGNRLAFAADFFQAFWQGYVDEYQLSHEWLAQMPTFLKLRDVTLYLVINKKLEDMDENTSRWMEEIKDRIKQDAPIVDIDYLAIIGLMDYY
ncbi:MAG: phosphotransferase [Gorillibacterium sp.]|nr:phosphotransferase [Gorillibacterium sp.]